MVLRRTNDATILIDCVTILNLSYVSGIFKTKLCHDVTNGVAIILRIQIFKLVLFQIGAWEL